MNVEVGDSERRSGDGVGGDCGRSDRHRWMIVAGAHPVGAQL
jgi:hypothetical protein